jgi:hypothetical protein
MAKHRSYSIEFKRQVAQEYLGGETLAMVGFSVAGGRKPLSRPRARHVPPTKLSLWSRPNDAAGRGALICLLR